MRILFVLRHPQYVRYFEPAIAELAERGHEIRLAITPLPNKEHIGNAQLEELTARYRNISEHKAPEAAGSWANWTQYLRAIGDYLRYLHPDYVRAPRLRARAEKHVGPFMARMLDRTARWFGDRAVRGISRVARLLDAAAPCSAEILDEIRRHQPDVIIASPVVDLGSKQREYLKAARSLGIRSMLAVASWDNLTNKGLIHHAPDRVLVWNEHQRGELAKYHGVPAEAARVTGAQCFDEWFDRRPSRDRITFCRMHDFDPARPIVLYLCSSQFIAPEEPAFVRRWLAALRQHSDPRLREANVLVRPHPANVECWSYLAAGHCEENGPGLAIEGSPPAVLWPRGGAHVCDGTSKADYFDSMYHAAAVVGINTSGLIEAAIIGRSCLTICDADFAETQHGTLHFDYLLHSEFVQSADDLTQHVTQLGHSLDADHTAAARRFVEDFVRPQGFSERSTSRFVEAVEALGHEPVAAASRSGIGHVLLRAASAPVAWCVGWAHRRHRARKQGAKPKQPAVTKSRSAETTRPAVAPRNPVAFVLNHAARVLSPRRWLAGARRVAKTARTAQQYWSEDRQRRDTSRTLRRMAEQVTLHASDTPIVVGPWLSEVGFELLYWIPWLRKQLTLAGLDRRQLIVVSRGGPRSWYASLSADYVDVLDLMSPEEFVRGTRLCETARGGKKQTTLHAWEKSLLEKVVEHRGLRAFELIHPSMMYRWFTPYWRGQMPLARVIEACDFGPLESVRETESVGQRSNALRTEPAGSSPESVAEALRSLPWPRDYIACKFYFSQCFPDNFANRRAVRRLIERLARHSPVVLLGAGARLDDHADFEAARCMGSALAENVFDASSLCTAANNLDVQTAIVANSRCFAGTYGGFSYLAPLVGKPSIGLYSEANFVPAHLQLAERVLNDRADRSFTAMPVAAIDLLADLLASSRADSLADVIAR